MNCLATPFLLYLMTTVQAVYYHFSFLPHMENFSLFQNDAHLPGGWSVSIEVGYSLYPLFLMSFNIILGGKPLTREQQVDGDKPFQMSFPISSGSQREVI